MNQQTKPSAGALRAARNLRGRKWLARSRSDDEETAQVIDRETGVAELLRTCKYAMSLAAKPSSTPEEDTQAFADLEQAIAKCESGTGSE